MSQQQKGRAPKAFNIDDPKLKRQTSEPADGTGGETPDEALPEGEIYMPTIGEVGRGFRWGALFIGAAMALSGLAAGLWFERFVSVTLARDDWIGWLSFGLAGLMGLAFLMIVVGELIGLYRLSRLKGFRRDVEAAFAEDDAKAARKLTSRMVNKLSDRAEMGWSIARFREHDGDIIGGQDILKLADRQLMAPLDGQARSLITKAAKRVALVTALSPAAVLDVLYVLFENLRLLRSLAGLYGGRPGLLGAFKLGRMVIVHIAATGGLALTDDLLGQFLGQDLLRRLSRRAGEGVFNGALTARIGIACVDVCRPLPFIEQKRLRFRDFAVEIFKRKKANKEEA